MAKAKTQENTNAATPAESFKYTLDDLEKATGLAKASLRSGLRHEGQSKPGSKWGWNTKADFDSVVKLFKERAGRAPSMTKAASKDEPAEKKVTKKVTKKAA